jgi:uncharacterized protein YkwD
MGAYHPARLEARHAGATAAVKAALAGTLLLHATAAWSDPMSVVNGLRERGCAGAPGVGARVRPHPALDDAARELARDGRLEEALDRAGYPAASSSAFHVRGSREDDAIRRVLAARFCESVNNPRFDEVGVFARGGETWIVLAVRRPPEPVLEPVTVARRVLELVNTARAEGRRCGGQRFGTAAPLTLSATLGEAALAHARDMAARGFTGHRGSDGSESGERITRAGYTWRASGENVASGQRDADAVVAAWLASPGHCATLMAPYFEQTGVAFALSASENPSTYWVQVFATEAP